MISSGLTTGLCIEPVFGEKRNGEKHVVQKNHGLLKSHFCVQDGDYLALSEHGSSHQDHHSVQFR